MATQTAGAGTSDTGVAHLGQPMAGRLATITHEIELIIARVGHGEAW